jgi:hypothetical protein
MLSAAGLVLVALTGLYGLVEAFLFRRAFLIRPRSFFNANATRPAPPPHMFMAYRAFPATGLVLSSFITILGFLMIFIGLVWLGVQIFRESTPSK